jgi:hypothetical protein
MDRNNKKYEILSRNLVIIQEEKSHMEKQCSKLKALYTHIYYYKIHRKLPRN